MIGTELIEGWALTRAAPRWVARQRIVHTSDHTITYRYESSFSFEGLLQRLEWRRSYEAGRKGAKR